MPYLKRTTGYIFVRLLLSALAVASFARLMDAIAGGAVKTAALLAFAAVMCLITAVVITRHIKTTISQSIRGLEETSAYLKEVAANLRDTAEVVDRNTALINEFACLVERQPPVVKADVKASLALTASDKPETDPKRGDLDGET